MLSCEMFSPEEKETISKSIKHISLETIEREMNQLMLIGTSGTKKRSRIGNNIVDFFTFTHRLETKGKYDTNFFEFVHRLEEFKQKKFIQNMLIYYKEVKNKNNTKSEMTVLKEVYNICISAINIIRPLVYMEIYAKYKPTCVFDFCAGWGGAAVAAAALKIDKYIGIEMNTNLEEPYQRCIQFLKEKSPHTTIDMIFDDARNVDCTQLTYDLVFTSPPYYFIQKYQNNSTFASKKEMDELFYIPLFSKTYEGLQPGGHYAINVCKEVYENVLFKLFGEAHESFSFQKSKRQNDYNEIVYVWRKADVDPIV